MRRHEQSDLVVVVQRTYGETCSLRKFADLEGLGTTMPVA